MFYEGVLLMELVKDADGRPAPRMIDVAIAPPEAISVYADLVAQIIAMLCCDLIHGDLSPYNILAAGDGPTIIDFPQVVSAVHSSRAEFFFLRDFDNVFQFLAGFDPALAMHRHDGRAIWRAYVSRELTREFVPPPPPPHRPSGAGNHRPREQRFDPRMNPRRGDGRQAQPQNPRSSGGPRRSDQPAQRDPRGASGARQDTASHAPNATRDAGWESRRPNNRGPSRQPPGPGARTSANSSGPPPAASRGRRRRPKRHW
jgi:RIO kinase 1